MQLQTKQIFVAKLVNFAQISHKFAQIFQIQLNLVKFGWIWKFGQK